jgi:hypothetical protein
MTRARRRLWVVVTITLLSWPVASRMSAAQPSIAQPRSLLGSRALGNPPPVQPTAPCTKYVATNGSDSNNGSLRSPMQTLQHAFNVSRPGDVICLRQGTYAGFKAVNRGGTAGNPLTIRPDTGAKVTLDAAQSQVPGWGAHVPLYFEGSGAAHIIIDGQHRLVVTDSFEYQSPSCTMWTPEGGTNVSCCFEVANGGAGGRRHAAFFSEGAGGVFDSPHHITIRNAEFYRIPGIFFMGRATDLVIENSHWHNDYNRATTYVNPYGTYLLGERIRISNNRIHGLYVGIRTGGYGGGGDAEFFRDGIIEGNLIYDNWGRGAWGAHNPEGGWQCKATAGGSGMNVMKNAGTTLIRNNIVWGNCEPMGRWGEFQDCSGIYTDSNDGAHKVYNNVIAFHRDYGLLWSAFGKDGDAIANNISYGNGTDFERSGHTFREFNNLFGTRVSKAAGRSQEVK